MAQGEKFTKTFLKQMNFDLLDPDFTLMLLAT